MVDSPKTKVYFQMNNREGKLLIGKMILLRIIKATTLITNKESKLDKWKMKMKKMMNI